MEQMERLRIYAARLYAGRPLINKFPTVPEDEIREGMKEFEQTLTIGGGKRAQ